MFKNGIYFYLGIATAFPKQRLFQRTHQNRKHETRISQRARCTPGRGRPPHAPLFCGHISVINTSGLERSLTMRHDSLRYSTSQFKCKNNYLLNSTSFPYYHLLSCVLWGPTPRRGMPSPDAVWRTQRSRSALTLPRTCVTGPGSERVALLDRPSLSSPLCSPTATVHAGLALIP